jgi:hypothetical protein
MRVGMDMETLTCKHCHTELVPQTSYCRKCGAAVDPTGEITGDERTTALLEQSDIASTSRLEPRPTSPEPPHLHIPSSPVKNGARKKKTGAKVAGLIMMAMLVVTIVVVKSRNKVASGEGLIYPGSTEQVNMVAEGGGRAVQLETSDSVQTVEAWYRRSMKPGKVIQLTTNSVVLKNEKTTVTVVGENNKTSILIKVVP